MSEPGWQAIRLALVALAIGFLGVFAHHLWEKVRYLAEENVAWGELRLGILLRQYRSPADVLEAFREDAEQIAQDRAFPYTIPADLLDSVHGLGPRAESDA